MLTNLDISIKINHGLHHFVQMHTRGESGTSSLIGQTRLYVVNSLCLCRVLFLHGIKANGKHKRKHKKGKKISLC